MSWSEALGRALRASTAVLLALGLASAATAAAEGDALPASLAQWYKPDNKRQVWLHTMFAMRRELQAVREYAAEGDSERVAAWSQRLADHYRRLPEMVPEWRDEADPAPIDALLAAAQAADLGAVQRHTEGLERDCRSCHRQYQALTALRYRWPRFDRLTIAGGDYNEHMERLSTTLNRVKIASEDGRWPVARNALGELRGQLDALGDGCIECHEDTTPRERILGSATTATLGRLDEALDAGDAKAAGRWIGEAAVQTCARCHGVHRLLAEVQRRLFD